MSNGLPFSIQLALSDVVALIVARVDAAFVVGLKPVGCSFLTQVHDCSLDLSVRDRSIDEYRCWDGVEMST